MTTPELAWAYFDTIKAPRKQFILVPGGHRLRPRCWTGSTS